MKRSYEADDAVFQKLRAAGKSSWDEQADPDRTFDNFVMRPFLEESLATIDEPLDHLSALEIGCGTGPIACFLAGRGMNVRGIDVSPTALDMAREHARQRGLNIRFDAADICRMPDGPERYDLIIDGHCMHYFVLDEHRCCAFKAIGKLLKPTGLLLIETMISHPQLVIGANYRLDAQHVLSIKMDDPDGRDDAFAEGDDWFAPYRRLLPANEVVAELVRAGFEVQFQRPVAQADPRKPMLFQIRASIGAT